MSRGCVQDPTDGTAHEQSRTMLHIARVRSVCRVAGLGGRRLATAPPAAAAAPLAPARMPFAEYITLKRQLSRRALLVGIPIAFGGVVASSWAFAVFMPNIADAKPEEVTMILFVHSWSLAPRELSDLLDSPHAPAMPCSRAQWPRSLDSRWRVLDRHWDNHVLCGLNGVARGVARPAACASNPLCQRTSAVG